MNHITQIADDDAMCQAMIGGIISRGSEQQLSSFMEIKARKLMPNQQCQVKVGERIKSTAQISPTSRRDI